MRIVFGGGPYGLRASQHHGALHKQGQEAVSGSPSVPVAPLLRVRLRRPGASFVGEAGGKAALSPIGLQRWGN